MIYCDIVMDGIIENLTTLEYLNIISVSKKFQSICERYKKTEKPFVVIKDLWLHGLFNCSDECINEFKLNNINIPQFGIQTMTTKDTLKLNAIVLKLGKRAQKQFEFHFYVVPWRFRKCIIINYKEEYNELECSFEKYILRCLTKCEKKNE